MLKQGRRAAVLLLLTVFSLVILLLQDNTNNWPVFTTEEAPRIPVERLENIKSTEMTNTLSVQEEPGVFLEVCEDEKNECREILAEADRVIADVQELLNQYSSIPPQKTEEINHKASMENKILADRGGYIGDKHQKKVPWYNLSQEELTLMAQVVQAEAGGEPYEGQVAVANVIFNRVKAGWAETVTEVLTQAGQFTRRRKKPSPSVLNAINEALYGKNAVPEGTLFFQNLDISKDSTIPKTKEYVTKIGRHTFFR